METRLRPTSPPPLDEDLSLYLESKKKVSLLDGVIEIAAVTPEQPRAPALIMSYNIWGIVMASPRPFSRPAECARQIRAQLKTYPKLFNKRGKIHKDKLVVLSIQEAWAVQGGVMTLVIYLYGLVVPHILAFWQRFWWPLAAIANVCASFVEILFVIITAATGASFFNCSYWTQIGAARTLLGRELRGILPHIAGSDIREMQLTWPFCSCGGPKELDFMDSGLMMMANQPITEKGFERFADVDEAAKKGVMWCYFEESQVVVINTHMAVDDKASGDNRPSQAKQMVKLLYRLEDRYQHADFYITGDFNRMLDWNLFEEAQGLRNQTKRVGAIPGDYEWGWPKPKLSSSSITEITESSSTVPDWKNPELRPQKSTSYLGVLDGLYVPKEKVGMYELKVSCDEWLWGVEGGQGCCCRWGAVDAVSDHKILWVVERESAGEQDETPLLRWQHKKFHWFWQLILFLSINMAVVMTFHMIALVKTADTTTTARPD